MKRFLFSLLCFLLLFSPAGAAEKSDDFWHLTHFTNPKNGHFEYCAVESSFDNGLSVAFARNRENLTNVVVGFVEAHLEEKTKYRMLLGIDGKKPHEITGFAADPKALVIPVQKDKTILDELRNGKLLQIKGPQDAVKFSLDGAGKALDQLQDCVDKSLKEETKKAPALISEPAKRALTVLSETAPTPGGEQAGEVEPLPLPKNPIVTSPPLVTPPPSEPQIAALEPVQPSSLPQSSTESIPSTAPSPTELPVSDNVPPATREPVQAAILPPVETVRSVPPSPSILTAVTEPPEPVISPQQPAPVVTPPAEANPLPVPAVIESAPYDQIVVVPQPVGAPAVAPAPALPPVLPIARPPQLAPVASLQSPPPVVKETVPPPPAVVTAVVRQTAMAPAMPIAATPPNAVSRPVQPVSPANLSLSAVLASLGIEPQIEPTRHGSAINAVWQYGGLSGVGEEQPASTISFIDHMLDAVDALEKHCKGKFHSELGAPIQKGLLVYAETMTGCTVGNGTEQGIMIFYQAAGRFVVISQQGQPAERGKGLQLREKLKTLLTMSTNYK